MAPLLEICNEVLLNIGENPVTYETHPVARKVFAAYRTALSHVSALYKWPHLIAERQATFAGDVGSFTDPPIQHVLDAVYIDDSNCYRISPAGRRNLWSVARTRPEVGVPCFWANYGTSQVRLYPEPSLTTASKVSFLVVNAPTLPTALLGGNQVTLPDDFLQAVKYYTEFTMHLRHTADLASANAAQSVFEQYVHMLRSRKSGEPVSSLWGTL